MRACLRRSADARHDLPGGHRRNARPRGRSGRDRGRRTSRVVRRARLKLYNQPAGDPGYALVEGSHPAGEPRIRDHVHARHEETFLVLEGEYQVRLGGKVAVAGAGDYVFVPRGTPHSYRNVGPGPARVLNIM
ncbi:MAG: cupin domain-containing protein, partial [Mycobacteriales bacterium]